MLLRDVPISVSFSTRRRTTFLKFAISFLVNVVSRRSNRTSACTRLRYPASRMNIWVEVPGDSLAAAACRRRASKSGGSATERKIGSRENGKQTKRFNSVLSYGCRCTRSTGALSWRLTRCGRPPGPTGPRLLSQYSTRGSDRGSARLSHSLRFAPHRYHLVEQPGCLSIPILFLFFPPPACLVYPLRSSDPVCPGWIFNAAAITLLHPLPWLPPIRSLLLFLILFPPRLLLSRELWTCTRCTWCTDEQGAFVCE